MAGIVIEVNEALYQKAVAALDPGQLRKALFQAVKRTTDRGRNIARKEIMGQLKILKKYVDRSITTQLDIRDPAPPLGIIRISRRQLPLIAYKPTGGGMRKGGKGGIRVKVWKDRGPLRFSHGFAATVNKQNAKTDDEFHRGVFIRTRHLSPAERGRGRKLTPKGFAGRLAIKQLMGPSAESAVELEPVAKAVYDGLTGEMDKQVQSQIDRFTK